MNRAGLIVLRLVNALAVLLLMSACATAPAVNAPDEGDFRQRMQSQESENVRISAAVPSAKESKDLFSKDLYKRGIQPVWLSIENRMDTPVTFLPVGLDPEYFTPLEVANIDVDTQKKTPVSLVDQFFMDQKIRLVVMPGEVLSGFIFTQLDEGTKSFNVDISSEAGFETFTFFIPVPGLNVDHYTVDWKKLYPPEKIVHADDEQLMGLVEEFACCVTDKGGENTGDPLNLLIIGKPEEVYTAFIRAGWDETEAIDSGALWKTFKSFVSGGEYRYSPISSLYVFERPQDVAFQKARENIHERNHLRLWMTRVRYQDLPVWIGQISRDIGVRFTRKTITTHKIDPDVDETREYLLEDMAYAQTVRKFGYLGGVGSVSPDQPRGNLTGDPWFTDGFRLVLWVSSEPVGLNELDFFRWRNPYLDSE